MVHFLCNSFSLLCNTKASIKFIYPSWFIFQFLLTTLLSFSPGYLIWSHRCTHCPWVCLIKSQFDSVKWIKHPVLSHSFIQLGSDHGNATSGTHSLSGVGLLPRAGAPGRAGEALRSLCANQTLLVTQWDAALLPDLLPWEQTQIK